MNDYNSEYFWVTLSRDVAEDELNRVITDDEHQEIRRRVENDARFNRALENVVRAFREILQEVNNN